MCRCWRMATAVARVLIIGAGDGGVLRRVLQHRGVTRAVMVEIDGEVIRLSKQHSCRCIAGDAWNDPRAEVIVGDGIDYVQRARRRLLRRHHRRQAPTRSASARCCSPRISIRNCARILTARAA